MKDEKLQEIHGKLDQAEKALRDLARRVKQDSKSGLSVCRNYSEWAAVPPDTRLDRARKRLDQEYYRVGIAGLFSSGKSTIINALVDEPDLLPTASHVCTLTRTILRAPEPGGSERVEVQYWTKDEAIRNSMLNPKFRDVFDADDLQRAESGTVSIEDIHKGIGRAQEGDREQQALAAELREFADALGIHEASLGRVQTVPISEKDQYLRTTAVEEDGVTRLVGIGHIRCIAHAIIYLNNPLFTQDHIELMDLPGTDDPDPTQKQITYDALKTIDVLISAVFGSRGLNEEDLKILDEMVQHHSAVTEKTFFAGNRMDDLQVNDITPSAMEGLVADGLIKHLTKRGFDATRVYLVSARYAELASKERRRLPMSQDEQTSLDSFRQKCESLLTKLGGIRPDLKDRLEAAWTDGGVNKLRSDLIDYLKHDIKTTHFKEVVSDLSDVSKNLNKLLDPERGDSWDLNTDDSPLESFIGDASQAFEEILLTFEDNLEKIFPQLVVKLREYVEEGVKNLLERDNKALNFKRIRSSLPSPGVYQIKSAVIIQAREEIGRAVVNLVSNQLAKMVASKVLEKLGQQQLDDALGQLDEQFGNSDLAARYKQLVKDFEEGLRRAAQLRINEEVVHLRSDIPEPNPGGGEWNSNIEAEFREELIRLINDKLAARLGRFDQVLPVHFRLISRELLDGLKALMVDLSKRGHNREDIEVPTLAGVELNPDEARRRALKGYLRGYEIAKDALAGAVSDIKSL